MALQKTCFLISVVFSILANSQVILEADGTTGTYELITSVLAPNANPVEVPDCNHQNFGRHIDQVFDNQLNDFAFRFFIHVTPDNDRCQVFDRQRNEIKTYGQSPDNLLGVEGETVRYKWKFKLPAGFQSSSRFTHIHQLKSVGGDFDSMPMYTLTTRKGSPDQMELRYASLDRQTTILRTDIAPFLNTWVEVEEIIRYGDNGSYAIDIKRFSDSATLLAYSSESIDNWRPDADFVRPKWGIYRGLVETNDLRDEQVLFADFSIEELSTASIEKETLQLFKILKNPAEDRLFVYCSKSGSKNLVVYDLNGRKVLKRQTNDDSIILNISSLSAGSYVLKVNVDDSSASQSFIISR